MPVTDPTPTLQIPAALLPADGRFGCGPSRVRAAQIDALVGASRALLGTSHRQRPVKALVGSVRRHLADLLGAPAGYEVVLGNGGSTAFWDAAAFGLIEHRSAHGTWGEFGAKFAKAARAPWLSAPAISDAAPGTRTDVAIAEDADVYAWPHNETSTGVAAPVRRVPAPGALTVVDATSAAGGIAFDAAEADVYYFAPQKNFGSDGGLWAALVSPAAIERIERIAGSGRYIPEFLSLKAALDNSRLDQTLNTPALATLVMLESQLRVDERAGRARLGGRPRPPPRPALLYDWAERVGYATPFVADRSDRSPVVVTIDFDGVDAAAVAKTLRANGVVDTEPYRKLGRNQLRIGTFASVEPVGRGRAHRVHRARGAGPGLSRGPTRGPSAASERAVLQRRAHGRLVLVVLVEEVPGVLLRLLRALLALEVGVVELVQPVVDGEVVLVEVRLVVALVVRLEVVLGLVGLLVGVALVGMLPAPLGEALGPRHPRRRQQRAVAG